MDVTNKYLILYTAHMEQVYINIEIAVTKDYYKVSNLKL